MGEVFQSFPDEVTYEEFYSLTELCDIILTNETAAAILNKTDDQSEAALQNLNATQAFINWLIDGVNYSVVKICETLANFVKRIIIEEKSEFSEFYNCDHILIKIYSSNIFLTEEN